MRKAQIKSDRKGRIAVTQDEPKLFHFQYSLHSSNGYEDASQLINEFDVKILWAEDYSDDKIVVGKGKVSHVLIDQMIAYGWDIHFMLNSVNHHLPEVVSGLFDFDEKEFIIPELEDSFTSDICVIESLHIVEKFRGKSIGASLLADIILRFGGSLSCVCFKSFPMQYDEYHLEQKDDFTLSVLSGLPKGEEKAQLSLKKYYESLGFKPSPHDRNIFYLATELRNPKIDKITYPLVWNKG